MANNKKLFCILGLCFFTLIVIGTLLHELGHYFFAKRASYEASIHYNYTHIDDLGLADSLNIVTEKYSKELLQDVRFPGDQTYNNAVNSYIRNNLLISAGGTVQTLATGTIGLILLIIFRKTYQKKERLNAGQWSLVFLTLFWLRQTVNMFFWVASFIAAKQFRHVDEIGIARKLNLPSYSIMFLTGVIGLIIFLITLFKFIPASQRSTFIAAGIAGGIGGYIVWFYWLGPLVLP